VSSRDDEMRLVFTPKEFHMDESKALSILSTLANGINPSTGEVFPPDSPYQQSEVVRALYVATRSLEGSNRSPKSRGSLPTNAGKPWTEDDDRRLLAEFDRGQSLQELARAHARTVAGIQARLEKHGRLQPSTTAPSQRRQWRGNGQQNPA
jgi:hypothetical protein